MSNDNRKLYENLRRLFPQRRLKKPATRIAGYDQEPSTFANPVDETTSIPNPDIFVPQPNKSITSEIQNAIEDEGESSTNSLDDSNKERIVTKADDAAVAKADDAVPKADNASDAPSPTPFMRPEPKPPKSLPKVALDLWDVAYESLKSENPGLWKDYERRIDLWLQAGGGKPRYSTKSQSISLSTMNYEERQKQMEGIISLYLSIDQDVETATDAETETDSDIENGEDTEVDRRSYNLSPYIRDIMKSSGYRVGDPSLPWAGICLSIESISYPAYKPKIALSRIGYIISRIRWYILLASLLNDDNDDNDDNFTKRSTIKEQLTLQDRITDLYKEILLYQAHVVCSQTEKIQEKYRTEADQYLLTRDGIISAAGVISAEKALACFSGQQVEEQLNSLAKLYDNETASATRDDKRYADANDVKDVLGRLSAVDPREKILELSEETLNHLYEWLCRTSQYTELTTGNSHGLWITGAPDSGRTMAMWAIIQGLSAQRRQSSHTSFVSFSFCGNGKHEVDRLKGHLVDKYESTGRMDFSDGNDAYVLSLALYDIIRDEQFKDTIFLINGIDEIENGVYFTKELINTTISISSKIKWVVATSNSHENIFISTTCSNQEDNLAHMNANDEHSIQQDNIPHIDMNNQQRYIQSILLDCYIPFKVEKLAQYNRLYQGKFRQDVTDLLCKLCPGNSLWVDIACEAIRQEDAWNALDILQRISQNKSENKNPFDPICEQMRINYPWPASKPLNQLSQNLLKHNGTIHKLYSNMLADIAELPFQDSKLCLRILFAMAVVYRPLDLLELEAALDLEPQIDLELLVKKCSAFLEMRGTITAATFFTENILQWLDLLISSSRLSQALTLISELQNHFSKKLDNYSISIK
ncbi:hypothetical protein TrVGV298_010845 [Trichoderma virens]|nr:hypothetical protein TrVGV298_010845 [Trichoderma virens]